LIRFGGGRLTEPAAQEGVSLLASTAFTAGGLGAHSADELRRILAGRNVGIHFSAGQDAFQLAGATTPTDLLLQLQLATAYLTDPGYRPESLRLARNDLRELFRRSRHTADGVLQAQVSRFLAQGDHRFGLPPEEKVMALELEDVANWLREPLESGYLEMTLVGDLSVEEAISAVAKTLGALPDRASEKRDLSELRQVSFPTDKTEKHYTFESDIPSGYAAVYWPTTDMWDIRETRRLQVLARAFSDRMRIRIREEMGDAYSPFAVSQPSETYEDYGLFFGLVGIDPERAEDVAEVVLEIAADIHDAGVTEDELERAIRPVITSLRNVVRDNSYWLNSVLASSQEYPQRLEWARHLISDYESITAEEVSALAERYLSPENALRVFVIPVAAAVVSE
jgi:zinc protease